MSKKTFTGEDGKTYTAKEKKPFYKKVWFWVVAVLVVAIFSSLGGGEEDTTSTASSSGTKEEVQEESVLEKDYAVGETASYEGYEVTVNSVEFSDGGEYDSLEPGNKFVIVNVTLTNNTGAVATFNPYDFKLNDNGVKTDMDAWYTDSVNELHSGELDEGASITGNLYGEGNPDNKLKLEYETSFWDDETVDFLLN